VSKLLSHLPKTIEFYLYAFKCYQNNVTSKNVSWPHFSWATLYIIIPKWKPTVVCVYHLGVRVVSWLS